MFGRFLPLFVVAGAMGFCAASPLQFEWANPMPHRQRWVDMASGNGVAVGLTDGFGGRGIYNSIDGRTWNQVAAPANPGLSRVKFADGSFVAVGKNDTIMTSPDGNDWTLRRTDPMKASLFDVAVGKGVTVAVGYNAEILASTDLKKWTAIGGLGSAYNFLSVEYGNGRFVAVGPYHLWTSTDGFTWTEGVWPQEASVFSAINIAFNNGVFVLNAGQILTSFDGLHWKVASGAQFRKVVSGPDGFLGVWPTLSKSTDGVNWDVLLDYSGDYGTDLEAATTIDGRLVAGGSSGLLFVSDDGTNFEKIVDETVDYSHSQMTFGNQIFVRYGDAPGVEISGDGARWESVTNTPALKSAVFGNRTWVGVGSDGSVFASTDARVWRSAAAPLAGTAAHFANGLFIVESSSGGSIEVSNDGANWRQVDVPEAKYVNVVGNVNGRWAAIIDFGRPAISDDGEHWIAEPTQESLQGTVLAAGNGRFVAIGGGGMGPGSVAWSTNGITWQSQQLTSGTTFQEESLTFGSGIFVLTDNYGDAYTSDDGINWVGGRQAEQPLLAAAYGNGRWLLAGGDSILRSSSVRQASAGLILSMAQQSFGNWALTLEGSAGDSFQIETASALGGGWTPIQTVQIPLTGRIQVSTTISGNAGFFRAVSANP